MPRVLFYLPTVTPWWFDNIVVRLVRALIPLAEVHILVPPIWRSTGIGVAQIAACDDLPTVQWHIVNDDSHPSLRTRPADPDALVDFVQSIAPDYVLCRSADIATPGRFPGRVVHLQEAAAPPFLAPPGCLIFESDFWHFGAMPMLEREDRETLLAKFDPMWIDARDRFDTMPPFCHSRDWFVEQMSLPGDRKIVALLLEYEHEEAFKQGHNRFERNIDLIRHVASGLGDEYVLAVSDHPLNRKYVDNSAVYAAIEELGPSVRLLPNPRGAYWPTMSLIKNCDGVIVQNTKAIYAATFFGKPVLRLSHRPTAQWIGAREDMTEFLDDVRAGAHRADPELTRLWFAFHILHEVISSREISGSEILDRLDQPLRRERFGANLEHFDAYQAKLDWTA